MSLSKYYKSSDSFQPDDLVKKEQHAEPGWQSEKQTQPDPFKPQDRPKQQGLPKPVLPQPVIEPSVHPSTLPQELHQQAATTVDAAIDSQVNEQDSRPAPPPPITEDAVDLSNYLELTVAEQKIEEAYQQGLQAGKEGVEQDYVTTTRSLLSICQQLDTIRETIITNSSEELRQFALSIAERILRISVKDQDQTIIATIEEALQRAVKSDEFTIYIHPDDYQTVVDHSDDIVAGLTGLNKVVIKQDSSLERGGAKIESENCTIDATIASQFEVIKEEIMKNL